MNENENTKNKCSYVTQHTCHCAGILFLHNTHRQTHVHNQKGKKILNKEIGMNVKKRRENIYTSYNPKSRSLFFIKKDMIIHIIFNNYETKPFCIKLNHNKTKKKNSTVFDFLINNYY